MIRETSFCASERTTSTGHNIVNDRRGAAASSSSSNPGTPKASSSLRHRHHCASQHVIQQQHNNNNHHLSNAGGGASDGTPLSLQPSSPIEPPSVSLLPPTASAAGPSTVVRPLLVTCPNNRYVRQARIGRGAFKEVFRAMDEDEGIEVAWNEIDFSQCVSKAKVIQEVELLKRLDHENVIACFASWEDAERHCLVFVTELMTSGTLAEFVAQHSRHALNRVAIAKYGRQILRGIGYLHSRGVIHRDLKCNNIFINGSKGEVKIGDLGVSIAGRFATSVIGTPEYMAPEMFGEHYSNAIDIWSFGLCLLEMTTGRRPYDECDHIGQIYKKLNAGILPSALTSIDDADVLQVVHACLAFDPNERPTAEQLLQNSFFHASSEDSVAGGSDGASSSLDNDSMFSAAARDFSVVDKLHLIDWLRLAPSTVRSDVIQFAVSRLWIDHRDADAIALSNSSACGATTRSQSQLHISGEMVSSSSHAGMSRMSSGAAASPVVRPASSSPSTHGTAAVVSGTTSSDEPQPHPASGSTALFMNSLVRCSSLSSSGGGGMYSTQPSFRGGSAPSPTTATDTAASFHHADPFGEMGSLTGHGETAATTGAVDGGACRSRGATDDGAVSGGHAAGSSPPPHQGLAPPQLSAGLSSSALLFEGADASFARSSTSSPTQLSHTAPTLPLAPHAGFYVRPPLPPPQPHLHAAATLKSACGCAAGSTTSTTSLLDASFASPTVHRSASGVSAGPLVRQSSMSGIVFDHSPSSCAAHSGAATAPIITINGGDEFDLQSATGSAPSRSNSQRTMMMQSSTPTWSAESSAIGGGDEKRRKAAESEQKLMAQFEFFLPATPSPSASSVQSAVQPQSAAQQGSGASAPPFRSMTSEWNDGGPTAVGGVGGNGGPTATTTQSPTHTHLTPSTTLFASECGGTSVASMSTGGALSQFPFDDALDSSAAS